MVSDELIRTVIVVVPIVSGSAIMWTARACASGRITRNWAIGIRLRATMKSDAAWLACHVRAKRTLSVAGLAMIVTGIAALLPLALPVSLAVLGVGAVTMLACIATAAVVGVRAAKKAA